MSKSQVKEANVTPPVKGILRHLKWEHLVAGVSGGAASTLLLHPLDLVKIRFQGKKHATQSSDKITRQSRAWYSDLVFNSSTCMEQKFRS